jgi:hypothetical protein
MAATIEVHAMTAADTGTDVTAGTARFHATDTHAVNGVSPLVVGAVTIYSYTITLRAYLEDAPSVQVGNMRWYSDGSSGWGTGVGATAKNVGTTFVAHYATAMSGGSSIFGYTSAAPLDGDTTDAGPFVPADVDTYIGDLIDLQMSVGPTATQHECADESWTLACDEV